MSEDFEWLPELIEFNDYNGIWEKYLEAIYEIFEKDFVDSKPKFQNYRVALRHHPITDGKEYTFWHFISEGKVEDDRTPDLRRCERIRWPKPIIESWWHKRVKLWKNKRGKKDRFVLSTEDFSYVVVLDDRTDYVLPLTAYYVKQEHSRNKLKVEYEAYKKANAASE